MILQYSLIILSLGMLFAGAEMLVKGSASVAARAGLTPLMIGLTVVAFGTSSPELAVSLEAAFRGQGDVAVGNVVGSNIMNIAVILGVSAMICPIVVHLQLIKIDVPIMIAVTLLMPLLLLDGRMGRVEGGFLFAGIVLYIIMSFRLARKETSSEVAIEFEQGVPKMSRHWVFDLLLIAGGLSALGFGSHLLIDNCLQVARAFEISEAVIGLTVIAFGTSVPELATSIVAAVRRQPDIALGNVVGSNIFNILAILGATTLVSPIAVHGIRIADYAMMDGVALLFLPILVTGLRLSRLEGAILLGMYGCYLYYLWPR